jgi:hypothetical protein
MLKPILTANWRYLAFLNFAVDPQLLAARVPDGTELDFDEGATFLSVVAYLSADTVLIDQPLPRQRLFERVDLRFYVRRRNVDDWRRGVVLVRSIVPRAVAPILAHTFPGEPLSALTMRHDLTDGDASVSAAYGWRQGTKWESIFLTATGEPQPVTPGSHEDFVTARAWAYTALRTRVIEHRIEHPRWRIWPASTSMLAAPVFESEFVEALERNPVSAFIADGSHVRVLARA